MPAVKLEGFQGIAPKIGVTQLTQQQAQQADNVRLYGGELLPWHKPSFVYHPNYPAGAAPIMSMSAGISGSKL